MASAEELRKEGNTAFTAGRYQEALTLYEQAITLDADNVDLLNNAAAASHALEKYDDAIAYARRSLCVRDNFKAHTRVGAALWALNRIPEASMEYERAAALSPGNPSVEQSRQTLLRLLQSSLGGGGATYPPSSTGKLGVCLDVAAVAIAVLTMFSLFFMPKLAGNMWMALMTVTVAQQASIASSQGLLRASKEALLKWADHRCTLELLLCLVALLSGVGPQMLLVGSLGVYSAVSLAANHTTLSNMSPTLYRLCSSYLQSILTERAMVANYAATLEAIMLFTVMFSGGAIFTLAYIQYVKNIYRIDSNTKIAFTGLRMNLSRITRHPYMPLFVDTYMQKFCDLIYTLSQQAF
ncbi:TPR Domain containing protein [Trypanosoma rangeli]|uniref:TPR Domain containing protein n=1 Tax=Trypanosoma rangeli TaxID=5698 RepID=A0A422P159_TRYRA|nr:TPR Domain containing protein [Trypanosoma rangeli]RNF11447.1 TPR Domain containing protein [Trypanosoma rangeli]|eukprot:RNF11447.1 TPR Domain containing protein [Trypanosoma rangeli]